MRRLRNSSRRLGLRSDMSKSTLYYTTPISSSSSETATENYIQILEKTNEQLPLWIDSLGVFVSALGVLFTALAIFVSLFGYWKYKSHKKELDDRLVSFMDATDTQIKRQIQIYDERFELLLNSYENKLETADNQQKAVIEGIMRDLRAERLRVVASVGLHNSRNGYVGTNRSQLATGSLIKGETLNSVYWYGRDGQRYTFPDEDVLKSWFPDVDALDIQKITDEQMASITLAGNMVYRAGTRLIKTISDPKIYVIGQNGLIHWVHPHEVIEKIFGSEWKNLLVTIKDVYFVDYTVGGDVKNSDEFNPNYEQAIASLP